MRFLLLLMLLAAHARAGDATVMAPRVDFGAPGELPGRIIHGVGCGWTSAATYAEALGPGRHPALTMEYIPVNTPAERMKARIGTWSAQLARLPADVGLQLGLPFTIDGKGRKAEYSAEVVAGKHDAGLAMLAQELAALRRPVFVRIGYECNGIWNGYPPAGYRAAFRHIAGILRAHCPGVATVWCVHPEDAMDVLMRYEPGDDVVDWWSIDLFEPEFLTSATTEAFLAAALARRKPVLIGESTPTGVGVGRGARSWNAWYAPYFALIHRHPHIKAFCYINWNWCATRWHRWKDSRIERDPVVLERFRAELADPAYQHAVGAAPAPLRSVAASGVATAASVPLDAAGIELVWQLPPGVRELVSCTVVIRGNATDPVQLRLTGGAPPVERRQQVPPTAMIRIREFDLSGIAPPADGRLTLHLAADSPDTVLDATSATGITPLLICTTAAAAP